jgi:hypothetical protein
MGVAKLVLETDSMGAVAKLQSKEVDRSIHGRWSRRLSFSCEVLLITRFSMCGELAMVLRIY